MIKTIGFISGLLLMSVASSAFAAGGRASTGERRLCTAHTHSEHWR
jgi:hypothetical protein